MAITDKEIEQNIARVKDRIANAATRAGREPGDITLVAVAKTHPVELIEQAVKHGISDIGENRAQELRDKAQKLKDLCRWHFIGPIQKNKVKYLAQYASVVHSIDRMEIAEELQKRLDRLDKTMEVLIEVNIGDEQQKAGTGPKTIEPLIIGIERLDRLKLCGLMCIPPFLDDPEATRPYFIRMRQLAERLQGSGYENLTQLSMGMTADFEAAIEEGATIVRVGTAIFGPRACQV